MTNEAELRTTSDAFLMRLDKLQELEDQKRLLTPGSDAMIALAAEIEVLTEGLLTDAGVQHDLAKKAREGGLMAPIEAVPPREAHLVLTDWRAAERRLIDAAPGSAEAATAQADIERLRDEYKRAFMLRSGTDKPRKG